MAVSENREPEYSTLNSRIFNYKDPQTKVMIFEPEIPKALVEPLQGTRFYLLTPLHLLGGSGVVISRVISPQIRVISIVTLVIILLKSCP